MKMRNIIKNPILTFIIGAILFGGTTGVLAAKILASEISYTPKDKTWKVNNVKEAIDDLHNQNSGESIFTSLTCTAKDNKSDIDVTIHPTFKSGYDSDDIFEYLLMVDGKLYGRTSSTSVKIKNYTASKKYNIKAIAVDKDTKLYKGTQLEYTAPETIFTKETLEYPVVTSTGIKNIKYSAYPDDSKSYYVYEDSVEPTASDALPLAGYDGDSTTFAGPYNYTYKYLHIDPSAYGKTITFNTNGAYWGIYIDEVKKYDGRASSKSFEIPSSSSILKVYGNENLKYYEITVN